MTGRIILPKWRGGAALRGAAILVIAAVGSCKPAAFASHEADLLKSPPPSLPVGGEAFWNDRTTGTYGELLVGGNTYREGSRICRTARVTEIDDTNRRTADRMLLYCQQPDGRFILDGGFACRSTDVGGVVCRTPQGDDVTLRSAGAP